MDVAKDLSEAFSLVQGNGAWEKSIANDIKVARTRLRTLCFVAGDAVKAESWTQNVADTVTGGVGQAFVFPTDNAECATELAKLVATFSSQLAAPQQAAASVQEAKDRLGKAPPSQNFRQLKTWMSSCFCSATFYR